MVTQFGYVGLYSTIWPLAPLMALINNWLELRSDAFKVTTHTRRPVPVRSDTIGPWLENMVCNLMHRCRNTDRTSSQSFISWLAALTNTALVYLFRPDMQAGWIFRLLFQAANQTAGKSAPSQTIENSIVPALLLVLSASHGYWILHVIVRHILGRVLWNGSPEAKEIERKEKGIKESYLKGLGSEADFEHVSEEKGAAETGLWADEGRGFIEGFVKTA
jgi:anoctamin-10